MARETNYRYRPTDALASGTAPTSIVAAGKRSTELAEFRPRATDTTGDAIRRQALQVQARSDGAPWTSEVEAFDTASQWAGECARASERGRAVGALVPPLWLDRCRAGAAISTYECESFEERLCVAPEDVETRVVLIGAYFPYQHEDAVASRARHVCALIEQRPWIWLGPYVLFDANAHGAAYNRVRSSWKRAVIVHPTDARVVRNAAECMMAADPALAAEYLRRGLSLEPDQAYWRCALGRSLRALAQTEPDSDKSEKYAAIAVGEFEQALQRSGSALPCPSDLVEAAEAALIGKLYECAAQLANDALAAAGAGTSGTQRDAMHLAHVVLGKVALASLDVHAASTHLKAAGSVRTCPQLETFGPDLTLAAALLARGERAAVASFLWDCRQFWPEGRATLEAWIGQIARGEHPRLR
jgi:hypothetical protein